MDLWSLASTNHKRVIDEDARRLAANVSAKNEEREHLNKNLGRSYSIQKANLTNIPHYVVFEVDARDVSDDGSTLSLIDGRLMLELKPNGMSVTPDGRFIGDAAIAPDAATFAMIYDLSRAGYNGQRVMQLKGTYDVHKNPVNNRLARQAISVLRYRGKTDYKGRMVTLHPVL